ILSPLPVWTGYKAADPLNVLIKKNNVYIDIGSGNAKAAFELLYFGLSVTALVLVCLYFFMRVIAPSYEPIDWPLIFVLGGAWLLITLIFIFYVIYSHFKHGKENMQTRFNRQRREVAWVDDKKQLHLVPWESFKAWVSSASTVGDSVAYRSALLGMGPPAYDDPHGFIGVWRMPCGVEISGIMQWEC
ncbi:hypothetical protein, partial [Zooshikella harenae]